MNVVTVSIEVIVLWKQLSYKSNAYF